MSMTIHMMTAALAPGDAIGNYIAALYRILREWGCTLHLYADHVNPSYPLPHQHSSSYRPTGHDLLWMHYSIYSDNIHIVEHTPDYVILDSHNVSPAWLYRGYNPQMEWLCTQGERYLTLLARHVDRAVVHTEYVRHDLRRRGYRVLYKIPLVVDTSRFTGHGDPQWEPLLAQLDYLLFVGRIVPQKNLTFLLDVFAALHRLRPQIKLFLVGGQTLPDYLAELGAQAERLGISAAVVFVGKVDQPSTLTSFFRHARFSVVLSVWESFCVPIVESLYFGTPVLGHNVPPIPETMGQGGVLLTGHPEEMATQIDALWDDTARYAQLQHAGQQHAQHFTDAQLRESLLHLFHALAEAA